MAKYIFREVAPEHADLSLYFDDDGLTAAGGDYCNNLFIVAQSRHSSGFNEEEYQSLQTEIENLFEMYEDIIDKYEYAQYSSVGAMLLDLGLVNNIHNTKRIKEITEWLKACQDKPDPPYRNYRIRAEAFPEETTAEYLTFKTGKQWSTDSARGYSQGDYIEGLYCIESYPNGIQNYLEIWLGAGKEFSFITLDESGEEVDEVYGYIVADSEVNDSKELKALFCGWEGVPEEETELQIISGSRTYTAYEYEIS